MNVIHMGIVGAGIWGENHIQIYQDHPFAEVVAICDQQVEKAKALANKYGIPSYYQDYHDMMKDEKIDAIAIVTPDFAHTDIAICAANHNKHMLIEKPLATKQEDVFQILEAVKQNHVRAMIDLHNRFSPPFHAAYEAIQKNELGELYSAYIRLNDIKWVATDMLPWASKSSILWFLGSHSLDTLRWLFQDEVKRVYSVAKAGILKGMGIDTIDEYLTTIEFCKGGIAQMENGWITPNANPCVNDIKCNLLGTKGMIAIDASNHNLIQKYSDQSVVVPDILVQHHIFGKPKGFAFASIQSFVDCLLSGEEFPVTIYDAANTTLAILAIMESAKTRMPQDVTHIVA